MWEAYNVGLVSLRGSSGPRWFSGTRCHQGFNSLQLIEIHYINILVNLTNFNNVSNELIYIYIYISVFKVSHCLLAGPLNQFWKLMRLASSKLVDSRHIPSLKENLACTPILATKLSFIYAIDWGWVVTATIPPNLDFARHSRFVSPISRLLQAMASVVLPFPLRPHLTRLRPAIRHAPGFLPCRVELSHDRSKPFPPFPLLRRGSNGVVARPPSAYVSGPASDPIVTEPDPKVDSSNGAHGENVEPPAAITWDLLWSLLMRDKLRLAVSAVALIGCSTCTLSMPLFSGKFSNYSISLLCSCLVAEKTDDMWRGKEVLNIWCCFWSETWKGFGFLVHLPSQKGGIE